MKEIDVTLISLPQMNDMLLRKIVYSRYIGVSKAENTNKLSKCAVIHFVNHFY